MSQWKRYIDDIFSLWTTERKEIDEFIALANRHHPSIKFTAEISDKEINFLDTTVYKGERFHNQGILDIRTHFKPTETFQYTHFSSCNPHGVRKGLIKGEALRILRTNSSAKSFYENICNFKKRLRAKGISTLFCLFDFQARIPGGGDSHMKQTGMFVGNFEFNP